jgi:dipeptidyl aminopeptidase/acylaminoacyl peptidase
VRLDLPYEKLLYIHEDWTALADVWWDESGGKLRAVAYGDNKGTDYFFEVDLPTGQVRAVLEEHMSPRMDLNSTPYNAPNVRWLENSNEIVWFSQRSGWGHLYRYDGTSGKLKNPITQGDWLVRDVIRIDQNKKQIYFTASGKEPGDPYYRYLYSVHYDGSGLTLLTPEIADHVIEGPPAFASAAFNNFNNGDRTCGAFSPDGRYVAYDYSRIDQPTRSAILDVERRTSRVFETADASALYAAGWRNPKGFVVKAADGKTDLYGVLYEPAKLDERSSYPIIDNQYASPLTARVPHDFASSVIASPSRESSASLAELEFAVVVVDARGTTFRSREFSHYSNGNLGIDGLDDHVAAIRQLAAARPWMDLGRVGIDGASYGGYATFRAMFEFPEFFKVGVSQSGMGSFSSMYPDSHYDAYQGRVKYANGSVFRAHSNERPVNYLEADNALQSKRLKGKLLIMIGELDENVLPGSTLQVVDSLVRADRDFDMYYFPNEAHRARTLFPIRKAWDYFVVNLHGQQAPAYHLKAQQ